MCGLRAFSQVATGWLLGGYWVAIGRLLRLLGGYYTGRYTVYAAAPDARAPFSRTRQNVDAYGNSFRERLSFAVRGERKSNLSFLCALPSTAVCACVFVTLLLAWSSSALPPAEPALTANNAPDKKLKSGGGPPQPLFQCWLVACDIEPTSLQAIATSQH